MEVWAGRVLGLACAAVVLVKVLGTLALFLTLRRKWRSVPELWGLDWLDIVYRVEQAFGVVLVAADFEGLSTAARVELTAGQLWEVIGARLASVGSSAPPDGWPQLVTILAEA